MTLSTYSLVSMAEFKEYAPVQGAGNDGLIERILAGCSERIERFLDREIVTRGNVTEYHTMASDGIPLSTPKLWLKDWPLISVISVHEDTGWPRTYGAGALLVEGTDYERAGHMLRRLGTGGPGNWATGDRAIRVVYRAGYSTTADVPASIKAVCLRFAAASYAESTRKQHGIQTQTDSTGNFTRFGPASLTRDMEADLYDQARHVFHVSWERASTVLSS